MAMTEKIEIKDLSVEELSILLKGMGKEQFRAKQIFKWLYKRDAATFEEMTDLSKDLRAQLPERFTLSRFPVKNIQTSKDGTEKLLLELNDGNTVEIVLIPNARQRLTLCISSQVGCSLRCTFCRTGMGGFVRNLTTGEITEQVMAATRHVGPDTRITNIVFMGMGEPLLNYDNVIKAIKIFYTNDGLNFSPRKITLSTVGLVPEMKRLGKDIEVSLAISIHAGDNDTRTDLMPINRKYPLAMLLDACREYPLRKRGRITYEYLLINGINDSQADARQLAVLMSQLKSKINLIPFNPFEGCDFDRPSDARIEAFQKVLLDKGQFAIIRKSKGDDILAACGQLRSTTL